MRINNTNEPILFSRRRTILFYSLLIGGVVGGIISFALLSIKEQSAEHINRLTYNSTNGVALLIKDDLKRRMHSLSSFTTLSELTTNMTDSYWQSISNALYDGQRGYHTLGWIDKTYYVRKVTPLAGNENAHNFNLALKPAALAAVMKAHETNSVTMTTPLQSIHGELGIGMYVPVFRDFQGSPKLEGFISSVLLFKSYFTEILPSYLLTDHQITVFINEQKIYSDTVNDNSINSEWRRQITFQLQGQTWKISTLPTSAFLEQSHYSTMRILLLLGILLTLLVTIVAYTTLSTRNKANVIKDERNKAKYLLKNLPGMAYQSFNTKDWPIISVNDGCEVLTGFTRAEFEAHDVQWVQLIHPDDYDRVIQTVEDAIKQQEPYELEYKIIDKNQEIHSVWEKGEAVISLLNNKVTLEGFITDLSNIKQAQDEVARSHAFSDAVVNAVIEAVITIDKNGRIKSFNYAAQRMFGYSADELLNQSVNVLIPNNEPYDHDLHIANYVKSNIPKIMGVGRELEAKRKDGKVFPIQISVSEISNQDDPMFVGLIRDIGSQRLSEDRARKHIEQMAHADRLNSLGEMAAGIAHEVNQPLTAISLFSQSGKTLCNNGKFDKLPEIFDKLSQHARRAGAVLERMQTMTRQGDRQKELVECHLLISEVVKLAESEGRMRDINIKVNFNQSSRLEVYIDRVQIQQVLLNLLRNGMEAMQSTGLSNGNVIELNSDFIDSENITISVVDSGCGLDSNMKEKLFTAFASTKQNGMGIGLSISKSIIEDHGGSIHYAKNATVGSVFYFTLPVV